MDDGPRRGAYDPARPRVALLRPDRSSCNDPGQGRAQPRPAPEALVSSPRDRGAVTPRQARRAVPQSQRMSRGGCRLRRLSWLRSGGSAARSRAYRAPPHLCAARSRIQAGSARPSSRGACALPSARGTRLSGNEVLVVEPAHAPELVPGSEGRESQRAFRLGPGWVRPTISSPACAMRSRRLAGPCPARAVPAQREEPRPRLASIAPPRRLPPSPPRALRKKSIVSAPSGARPRAGPSRAEGLGDLALDDAEGLRAGEACRLSERTSTSPSWRTASRRRAPRTLADRSRPWMLHVLDVTRSTTRKPGGDHRARELGRRREPAGGPRRRGMGERAAATPAKGRAGGFERARGGPLFGAFMLRFSSPKGLRRRTSQARRRPPPAASRSPRGLLPPSTRMPVWRPSTSAPSACRRRLLACCSVRHDDDDCAALAHCQRSRAREPGPPARPRRIETFSSSASSEDDQGTGFAVRRARASAMRWRLPAGRGAAPSLSPMRVS